MKKYLDLIRIKQWIKNLLIFLPLICANVITKTNLLNTTLGFLSFSSLASFIYIINDIKDIEKDKLHDRKKTRPLPSGKITKKNALIIACILLIISLIINYLATNSILNLSLYLLIAYLIINLLYSFGLKNIALIDIYLLTSGFIIRVYYGASLVKVSVSSWLFLTILSAALFLVLGKRKKELINSKDSRKVLKDYNETFLDKFEYLSLGITIIFYSLWTIEQTNKYLIYTVPIIILIFMRYSLTLEKGKDGDPTTILYKDKALLALSILYTILIVLLLGGIIK